MAVAITERDILAWRVASSEDVVLENPFGQSLEDRESIVGSMNRFALELYSRPEMLDDLASKYLKKSRHFPGGRFVLAVRQGTEFADPFRCRDMSARYSFMLGFERKSDRDEQNDTVWLSIIGIDSFKSSTRRGSFESWYALEQYKNEYEKLQDFPLITRIQGVNPREYGGGIMDTPEQALRSEIMSSFRWEAVMVDSVREWSRKAGFTALYLQPGEKNRSYLYDRTLSLQRAKLRYDGIARRCHFKMSHTGYYLFPLNSQNNSN